VLSDKLFYWLFQSRPDRILNLLDARLADAGGYRFSAPALKEREYRLDGLFLPPPERPELPALILEAQMGPDPGFLRRLYAESARLLQQEPSIHAWQVVVITPSRLPRAMGRAAARALAGGGIQIPSLAGTAGATGG
jgi:predicted transposase YdaD